jgi:hypothetical protein
MRVITAALKNFILIRRYDLGRQVPKESPSTRIGLLGQLVCFKLRSAIVEGESTYV